MYDQYGYETFIFFPNIGLSANCWVNCKRNPLLITLCLYLIYQGYLQVYISNEIRWAKFAKFA